MYIYELPFEVNRELCRLLDNDEEWKELAGVHMRYSPFDVNVSMIILIFDVTFGFSLARESRNPLGIPKISCCSHVSGTFML